MIEVRPGDELVEFDRAHVLSEFLGDPLKVFHSNEAGLLIIEEVEDLPDVIAGVAIVDLLGEQVEPLLEIDGAVAVGVEVRDHLEDGSAFGLETKRDHGCFELYMDGDVPLMSTVPPWSESNRSKEALAA